MEIRSCIPVMMLALLPLNALASCPDVTFVCPGGESFKVGSSFNVKHMQCETDGSILGKAMSKCPGRCGAGWKGRADGCSIPVPGLKQVWSEVFHGACDLHDLCYSSCGNSKADCDSRLFKNMKATCSLPGLGSVGYGSCMESAGIVYSAVTAGGGSSYANAQKWGDTHCSKSEALSLPADLKLTAEDFEVDP